MLEAVLLRSGANNSVIEKKWNYVCVMRDDMVQTGFSCNSLFSHIILSSTTIISTDTERLRVFTEFRVYFIKSMLVTFGSHRYILKGKNHASLFGQGQGS